MLLSVIAILMAWNIVMPLWLSITITVLSSLDILIRIIDVTLKVAKEIN